MTAALETESLWTGVYEAADRVPRRWVNWVNWWRGEEPKEHRFYLGSGGTAWDVCCRCQIADKTLRPFPELAMLRPYLKALTSRQRAHRVVDHPHLLERRPPLFFDGLRGGELTYVDIDRAYWSIYTRSSLDVSYDGENKPRNGGLRFLEAGELAERKILRNAVLGSLRRKRRRGLDHGEPFVEAIDDKERRPNLWGLVMDLLELIAWDMRDLGAIYVHTDGFIFGHHDLAEDGIQLIAERYGLEASVRARGEGYVAGIGRWRIGEQVHGPYLTEGAHVDSMIPPTPRLARDLAEWCKYAR